LHITTSQEKSNLEQCSCKIIHEKTVKKVQEKMPQDEKLYELAELFKIFGDSTRIKILCALFSAEMCVCDLAALLNISQSAISHQLRILRQSRLVKPRREGRVVYYSLDDQHVQSIFDQGFLHITEE